jgi:hypothetical protein
MKKDIKEITFSGITDIIANNIDDKFKKASEKEKVGIIAKRIVTTIKKLILNKGYEKIKIAGLVNFNVKVNEGGLFKLKGDVFKKGRHKKLTVKVSRNFQKEIEEKLKP